jgi:predicted nucleic acid-binding protein
MMVVIADTSPINYLIQIGQVELLQQLYQLIVIPAEVFQELSDSNAPAVVQAWIGQRPHWLEVRHRTNVANSSWLLELDPGERAAIQLAQIEQESLLVMDDAAGRKEAQRLGLPNIGTLGVLRLAATEGLVELHHALDKLMKTNFRVSAALIQQLIDEEDRRRF